MVDHVTLISDDKRLVLPLMLQSGMRLDLVDIETEQLTRQVLRVDHEGVVAVSASGLAQENIAVVATLTDIYVYSVPIGADACNADKFADPVYTTSCGDGCHVTTVSVEDDAEYIYVGCSDGALMVWRTEDWYYVGLTQLSDASLSRISPTQYDEMVVVVSGSNTLTVCNQRQLLAACAETSACRKPSVIDMPALSSHRRANAAAFVVPRGADANLLITVDTDGYMRLWNVVSFVLLHQVALPFPVTHSELTLACGGTILVVFIRNVSKGTRLMLGHVDAALQLSCTTVEDVPGRIVAVALGVRDTDLFVASKTGDSLSLHHMILNDEGGRCQEESVITVKTAVVTDDVALKITTNGRYAALRLGCSEKEVEIIVKSEKSNNLFISSGRQVTHTNVDHIIFCRHV